jgi:hypothetical protein
MARALAQDLGCEFEVRHVLERRTIDEAFR